MGENRRFVRFDVLMDAVCRTGDKFRKLKVSNFCREGIGILSRDPFKEGEDVEIELTIPGDNVPVLFEGRVVWSNNAGYDDIDRKSGVKFKKINNVDRGRILEHVYNKWLMPAQAKAR